MTPATRCALLTALLALSLATSQAAGIADDDPHYAYLCIYVHNQPESVAQATGCRVALRSVLWSGSKHLRGVVVSADTPPDVRAVFANDGVRVIDAVEPNPLDKDGLSGRGATPGSCTYTWMFVSLYRLSQHFRRVVLLEPDVVVFRNMDDLFLCGRFCMCYTNTLHWLTGVLVIGPNEQDFERLKKVFLDRAAAVDSAPLLRGVVDGRVQARGALPEVDVRGSCQDAFYEFIITAFPGIEAAKWFSIEDFDVDSAVPSNEAAMRFSLMYVISGTFFYEHFHWDLYRLNLVIPPTSSAFRDERRLPNLANEGPETQASLAEPANLHVSLASFFEDAPTFSISFTKPKPYHWFPAVYFGLAWGWHDLRRMLFPEEAHAELLELAATRIGLLLALVGGIYFGLVWLARRSKQSLARPSERAAHLNRESGCFFARNRGRLQVLGLLIGTAVSFISALYLAMPIFPAHAPPGLAWPLFCIYHSLFVYVGLLAFALAMGRSVGPENEVLSGRHLPSPKVMLIPLLFELVCSLLVLRVNVYPHLGVKMVVMFALFVLLLFMQATLFRDILLWRYMGEELPGSKRKHVTQAMAMQAVAPGKAT